MPAFDPVWASAHGMAFPPAAGWQGDPINPYGSDIFYRDDTGRYFNDFGGHEIPGLSDASGLVPYGEMFVGGRSTAGMTSAQLGAAQNVWAINNNMDTGLSPFAALKEGLGEFIATVGAAWGLSTAVNAYAAAAAAGSGGGADAVVAFEGAGGDGYASTFEQHFFDTWDAIPAPAGDYVPGNFWTPAADAVTRGGSVWDEWDKIPVPDGSYRPMQFKPSPNGGFELVNKASTIYSVAEKILKPGGLGQTLVDRLTGPAVPPGAVRYAALNAPLDPRGLSAATVPVSGHSTFLIFGALAAVVVVAVIIKKKAH